jgi:hypothetical protein
MKGNVKCQNGKTEKEPDWKWLMIISRLNVTVKQSHLEAPNLKFMTEK